jgi:hypothetical protein
MNRGARPARRRNLVRLLLGVLAFGTSWLVATPAHAASTCVDHNGIDGFNIGVCVNAFPHPVQTTAIPEIYINKTGNTANCSIEIELWSENGFGRLTHRTTYNCSTYPRPQQGYRYGCDPRHGYGESVHADAYLHTSHGGFRVGRSLTAGLICYPS